MLGESTAPSGSLSCHSAFEPPAAMNESLSCQPPCGDALPAHVFYNHTGRVTTLLPTQYWWTAAKTDTGSPSQRVLPDPTLRSCWSSLSEIGIHLSKDLDPDQARLPFASQVRFDGGTTHAPGRPLTSHLLSTQWGAPNIPTPSGLDLPMS